MNEPCHTRRGFSLVEILAVITVIGIVVAILVPVVAGVRTSALESKTRAQLAQYTIAYQAFRADRGFFPTMGAPGAEFNVAANNDVFIATLSGFLPNGARPAPGSVAAVANPRGTAYYAFQAGEFALADDPAQPGALVDAFGNPNIVAVIDRDGNNLIARADFSLLEASLRPEAVPGGVVFYVHAPRGHDAGWRTILSWE